MDATDRGHFGTLLLAVPLGVLAALPLAVLLAVAVHLRILWAVARLSAQSARAAVGRVRRPSWPLPEPSVPATLALPRRR
jgi:hypothetical protein